jgi:hypothetical protein
MFLSRYMPCPECGASLERIDDTHRCEQERRLDYQVFQLRAELDLFESELGAYLASPGGRFSVYYAERARRQG